MTVDNRQSTIGNAGDAIANSEDFKALRDARAAERVVLPKLGKAVLLRRPTPMWFLFRGQLPTSLASRFQDGPSGGINTMEDFQALANWVVPLLSYVFVEPRLSLDPGAGEISPDLLDIEDASFVIRWAVGEIQASGGEGSVDDLRPFRGEPQPPAAGSGGGDLGMPA